MQRSHGALIVLACFYVGACTSVPNATELPFERVLEAPAISGLPEDPNDPEITVASLLLEGVRGGRITIVLPGTPDDVLAMLLDFDQMTGKRPWAVSYRFLGLEGDAVLARWTFKGRLGIHPQVELRFEPRVLGSGHWIRFQLEKPAFGLAAFFGDYRIAAITDDPDSSILEHRLFIDSGLWIANASEEDIVLGLRADARDMNTWMVERLGRASEPELEVE